MFMLYDYSLYSSSTCNTVDVYIAENECVLWILQYDPDKSSHDCSST